LPLQDKCVKQQLFQSLQGKQGFPPAQQHAMATVFLLPEVYGLSRPGEVLIVVGDADTTSRCY